MDVLSGVLRSLRLHASFYRAMVLSAPWGMSLPKSNWAPFYLVESGSCWLLCRTGRRLQLKAGDLVVLFHGDGHALCDAPGSRVDPLETLLRRKTSEGAVHFGGGGTFTGIVCGRFSLDDPEGPPGSLRHLPNLLHLPRGSWPQFGTFSAALRLLAHEVGSAQHGSEHAARSLTEVLLIQVLRMLWNRSQAPGTGWWQALRDPPIAASLAAIHDKPGHPWCLESLAAHAGLSRSVFAARFRQRTGNTPMAYVAAYRLRLAYQWLQETELSVSEVFQRLGYASAAAFHRAFKRKYCRPPSAYRREPRSAELMAG